MDNFLNRLNRNPYQPIDGASVTKFDELGNGLDDWGNVIAPMFEAPEQTWGETALGVATAPARLATALAGSLSPYGADGWQVPPIVNEGVNALTAVGDAYTQGMSEDEMRNRALGMAGFMMGGGGLAARPTVRAAPSQIAAKSEMDIAMENLRRAVDDDLGDKSPYWNRPLEPRDLTLYHGTGSAFDRFNTPDVWASDSADMASNWAMRKDNPSVIPLEVKGARITRPRDQTLDPEAERARALAEGYDAVDWGKFDGGNYYQLVRPGTVKSPTTGETLFSNASKEGAVPALASALSERQPFTLDKIDGEYAAMSPSGDMIGNFRFEETPQAAFVVDAMVKPEYRRQGVASQVYGAIQDDLGKPLTPDVELTPDGYAFWKQHYPDAVQNHEFKNGRWIDPVGYVPDEVPDWRLAGGPNRPEGALWSNADSKPALLAGALSADQGVAGTGTSQALRLGEGSVSPNLPPVGQMADGLRGRSLSQIDQQGQAGQNLMMSDQSIGASKGTPIGSFLDKNYYPGYGLNPIHTVNDWSKVRSMARKAIKGDHVPGYLYGGLHNNGNLLAGTHRSAANELLEKLGYNQRIDKANINDVLEDPSYYGLTLDDAMSLREAVDDGAYDIIDDIWDQTRDTSVFSNADSRPALLASALGQEQKGIEDLLAMYGLR